MQKQPYVVAAKRPINRAAMPVKSPAAPKRAARKTVAKPIRLIVRRGAQNRFESLKQKAKDLNVVIEWDRREGERRQMTPEEREAERRNDERRQKPPFTWESADFVVVVDAAGVKRRKAKR